MNASLKQLVLGAAAVASVAVFAGFSAVDTYEDVVSASERTEQSARRIATITAPIVVTALIVGDLATAEESLEAMNAEGAMARVLLVEPDGHRVMIDASPREPRPSSAPAWFKKLLALDFAEIRVAATAGGVSYGVIAVTPSTHIVENETWARVWHKAMEGCLLLLVLMVVLERLLHFSLRPIRQIASTATRFGEGDYAVRMPPSSITEAQRMATSFNAMADSLQRALRELQEKEAGLRQAMKITEIANRSKTEFLTNMSHELRTPLNAIIGFSSVIDSETHGPLANPKYREYVSSILESGEHLLAIINDLLDLSAIESDSLKLNVDLCDVTACAESALRLVGPRAANAKVELRDAIDRGLAPFYVDERRLKQILLNLLTNAIKFTPSGGHVELKVGCTGARDLIIAVRDTGIGMDKAGIAKALERFGQVDAGWNRRQEGAGLGLPLTKGLIELHDGEMKIESKPGVGTVITVTLPNRQAGKPAPGAGPLQEAVKATAA